MVLLNQIVSKENVVVILSIFRLGKRSLETTIMRVNELIINNSVKIHNLNIYT